MGRTCTICRSEHRAQIDAALIQGAGYREIAENYGLSLSATARHKTEHLPAQLQQHQESISKRLERMTTKALVMLDGAMGDSDGGRDIRAAAVLTKFLAIFASQRQLEPETQEQQFSRWLQEHPDLRRSYADWLIEHQGTDASG